MEYLYAHSWLISVLFTIFIALLISWMLSIVQRRLLPKLQRTQNTWDDTLLSAVYLPLICLVWGVAITLMMSDAAHKLGIDLDLINYLTPLRETLFVGALLWFCIRYINRIEISLSRRTTPSGKKRDRTTIHALCQLFRAFSAIVALLWIMQIFKMPINTLLAAGGIGGVALSFAARDTLANFLGGLMIFWDRPFSVGDSVRSPDRNIEGTVEYIGWRLTKILTPDKRPLYVPNGIFSTIALENPSRMTHRHIKTQVGLRYEDAAKIRDILDQIRTLLKNHPDIDQNELILVNFTEFSTSSLNLLIHAFTKTTDWKSWLKIQENIYLQIIDVITSAGAACALPTTTVHIPAGITLKQEQR